MIMIDRHCTQLAARTRNFTTMTGAIMVTGFAILATFLPLTIYLQAILHMTSLRAGLTIAV
jgi:hypothetical protein